MEMKPENVPDEVLTQDYMIGLDIPMMQAGGCKLLIQLEMEELFSEQTVTTFRFVESKDDILRQLRQ